MHLILEVFLSMLEAFMIHLISHVVVVRAQHVMLCGLGAHHGIEPCCTKVWYLSGEG